MPVGSARLLEAGSFQHCSSMVPHTVTCWRCHMSPIHCMSICTFLGSDSYIWALLLFVVATDITSSGEVIWLPKVITQGMKTLSLQLCELSLRLWFWHSCQAKQRFQYISAFQTRMSLTFGTLASESSKSCLDIWEVEVRKSEREQEFS